MVKNELFGDIYRGKKVLITGNTGFKGSWLSTWLISLGADVYGISKDIPTKPSMFEELGLAKKMTHFTQDVRNYEQLKETMDKISPNFVFHLAAQPIVSLSYSEPLDTISSNVMGTANVLEVLRHFTHACTAV
ncbi:MAG: GDP-mannose 4,6-dehydratase [Mucinivorans sp.]